MDEKTTCIENLLGIKEKFPWTNNYIEKLLKLRNCFKYPKRRNHKKIWYRKFSHICPIFVN
jgi:hypothetical protein